MDWTKIIFSSLLSKEYASTVNNRIIKDREVATDASVYDVYEQDDFGMSCLLVESKLGEPMGEKIRIRYDHLVNFYDLPGPAIFAMVMDICNAPFRTGSKLLKKLTLSSCEEINRKAFALLDLVKQMEGPYNLADPKLITQDNEFATLGPIDIVAWDQKEHTQLVTDHEWPSLAAWSLTTSGHHLPQNCQRATWPRQI
jgi:hypothetical protein